jgi:hypothetical protein
MTPIGGRPLRATAESSRRGTRRRWTRPESHPPRASPGPGARRVDRKSLMGPGRNRVFGRKSRACPRWHGIAAAGDGPHTKR